MTRLTGAEVARLRSHLLELGYGDDVEWAQNCKPPTSAEQFASEIVFVIVNSGMKNTIAERILYERVYPAIREGRPVAEVFGHKGKAAAIERVWSERAELFDGFMACSTDEMRLDFLVGLPWVGNITKFHAARNFGVDCVKPDVHLQRLGDHHDETPHDLCRRLATELGDGIRVGTVDALLWRACAVGLIDSRTGLRRSLSEFQSKGSVPR